MRPLGIALAFAAFVIMGLQAPALAASTARFMPSKTGAAVTDIGALAITFEEAGVDQNPVSYTLDWGSRATYACLNGGTTTTVSASASMSLLQGAVNHRVRSSFLALNTPPGPGSFTCPSGETLVLASVGYKATLTDTSNNVSVDLSAARTFVTI